VNAADQSANCVRHYLTLALWNFRGAVGRGLSAKRRLNVRTTGGMGLMLLKGGRIMRRQTNDGGKNHHPSTTKKIGGDGQL